jgi:hypothetical protein
VQKRLWSSNSLEQAGQIICRLRRMIQYTKWQAETKDAEILIRRATR